MSCHVRKVYSCAEPSGLYLTFTETDDVAVTLRKSARPLNNVNGMFGMNGMNGVNGTSGMNYMNCMMPNSLQSMMNMMQQHTHTNAHEYAVSEHAEPGQSEKPADSEAAGCFAGS